MLVLLQARGRRRQLLEMHKLQGHEQPDLCQCHGHKKRRVLVLLQARDRRRQLLEMHQLLSDEATSTLIAVNAMVTDIAECWCCCRPETAGDSCSKCTSCPEIFALSRGHQQSHCCKCHGHRLFTVLVLLQARDRRRQLLDMHKLLFDGAMSNLISVNAMVTTPLVHSLRNNTTRVYKQLGHANIQCAPCLLGCLATLECMCCYHQSGHEQPNRCERHGHRSHGPQPAQHQHAPV